MSTELTTTQEPSVALMLSGFIDKGITAENVAAIKAAGKTAGLIEAVTTGNLTFATEAA